MDIEKLIGMRVMHIKSHKIGTIKNIENGMMFVNIHGNVHKFAYPAAFANILELESEDLQNEIQNLASTDTFADFKLRYGHDLDKEIEYLKSTGGKKYKVVDGEKIPSNSGEYLYAFDTDIDLHFPDGTAIKLIFQNEKINGNIVSCEEFTIIIRTKEYIGESIESAEFTCEQWHLLESLKYRLEDINPSEDSLAYEVACRGKSKITRWPNIKCGQNNALNRATSERITFIWGPPGTGKTETLANIALEHITNGRRVLMLSYSNVSVDGALLRVAKKADLPEGTIIRYGHPIKKSLLDSNTLTSYKFVLHNNPEQLEKYKDLIAQKNKLSKKSAEKAEINKKLAKIRNCFLEEEKKLIKQSAFVATTVSKAVVDSAVYSQRFDVVIFDEASMAYIPQIVFAASLAKSFFVCLGDFCQLPAIVQNNSGNLQKDIFEHTGITQAVENGQDHEWLVMLNLQYRMHHDIADFVSEHMYHGMLKTSDKIYDSRNEIAACCPCENLAMSFVDLSGMYSVCTKTMDESRVNILSAFMSLRLAEKNVNQYEIGIITPYSAQSRLILSMIRDIQELDKQWMNVTCATVHQFQGSEKPIIIYDAVDCFRMAFPGVLLTSMKNDTANRLFNVALTRSKGKFVLLANIDYLKRKNISKKLIFTKAINHLTKNESFINGNQVISEMMPTNTEKPFIYVADKETSWRYFIEDIKSAEKIIKIDIPDLIDDNEEKTDELIKILLQKKNDGLDICIRLSEDVDLPEGLQQFVKAYGYVTNPVTVIDKKIVWFGQPLYAADFRSENNILETEYFPCIRFEGKYTARSIQAFLEM